MKILIENYSSSLSTEPMYLNFCFNQTNSITSSVWNTNNFSTFDALDYFTPDVLLCHYKTSALNDVFKYLSKSKKKTELVINISGAQDGHIQILEDIIEKNKIESPFFISNFHEKIYSPKSKKKVLNLLPAVDLFLPKQNVPKFAIDAAIISNNKELSEKVTKDYNTYHKIGVDVNDEYYDFIGDIINMNSLYEKYDKVVLAADLPTIFSQLFFDAMYKSKKVILKSDDTSKMDDVLANIFEASSDDEDIATSIKNQIKNKHTCFNRTERLARALKLENAAKILKNIGDKI